MDSNEVPVEFADVVAAVESFGRDLTVEDELRAVVYAHLHLERLLTTFVHFLIPCPSALARIRLSYTQWVGLALALGLKSDLGAGLRTIGSLRNTFAHTLDTKLTAEAASRIFESLQGLERRAVAHSFAAMKAAHRELHWPENYSGLSPRDQFSLLAMTIFTSLYSSVLEVDPARRRS